MKRNRKNRLKPMVLMVMVLCLVFASPQPMLALSSGDTLVVTAVPLGSVVAVAAAGYLLYKNRLSEHAGVMGRLGYEGPGEFFIGGFFGGAFVPDTDWKYQVGSQNYIARNLTIDPGVTGGIKLGYFFDSIPYLGVEAEGSIGNHPQPSQSVALHPPLAGATAGRVSRQTILAWTMAFHLVGRYGFLKDKELPFGRLQPYVGLGPGLVILYGDADSAKNFALELEGGLRYMFTKHVGGFLEYKFSKQWSVELESQQLFYNNTGVTTNKAVFDFDRHQVVVGLAYHF
ncbi:MAG: porin family protein [Deltaproteobacteria bacterium]|nr:porin family protein [Deltaproteobacteria bacterium]